MNDEEFQPTRRNWWSFASLTAMQTQNAFNDNIAKFVLMPLGAWLAARQLGPANMEHYLALLLVLPYILFAPTAGWLSDRFSKNRVIRYASWFQLVALSAMAFALWSKSLWMAVIAFFLLATQSAVLSPAKLGVVKELVGSRYLALGSGVMEGTVILAILAGQIGGGFWFDLGLKGGGDGWHAAFVPVATIGFGGVLALLFAHGIEKTRPLSNERFTAGKAFTHFRDLREVWQDLSLKRSALGVAFFWGFGGFANLVIFQIAREAHGGEEGTGTANSIMLFCLLVGIAAGSFLSGWISKGRIALGLTILGGFILTGAMIFSGLTVGGGGVFYLALGLAGFGAAFFLVPLQAYLMDESPEAMRGKVLAASNLLNMLASIVGIALQFTFLHLGVPPSAQLVVTSVTVVIATYFAARLLPPEFVRSVILGAARRIYRVETFHAERMPKEGGLLVVPNHVTWVDTLVLSVASPRHLRFLMIRKFFDTPLIGDVARMFETIPISASRAKDAIRAASDAVEGGAAVCIFPEGQLTRSGMLNEIKSGYSIIARKAGCPVQPVYVDGLWGSVFSAERGRYFWKRPRGIPYGVRVSFGEVVPAGTDAVALRACLNREAGKMLARRREVEESVETLLQRVDATEYALRWWSGGELHSCTWRDVVKIIDGVRAPAHLAPDHAGARRWLSGWQQMHGLPPGEIRALVINALQLMECGSVGEGRQPVAIHPEVDEAVWRVWGLLVPVLTRTTAVAFNDWESRGSLEAIDRRIALRFVVGGEQLAGEIERAGVRFAHWDVQDFAGPPQGEIVAGPRRFRSLAHAGRVVALSLPDPPLTRTEDSEQPGWRAGSFGRTLPGIAVTPSEAGVSLEGPGWEEPVALPGYRAGADGFVGPLA